MEAAASKWKTFFILSEKCSAVADLQTDENKNVARDSCVQFATN